MTNHPNRSRTYWFHGVRGFQNEYAIGIANTKADAADFETAGYTRITREQALKELTYKDNDGTKHYVTVSVAHPENTGYDRFSVANDIRNGRSIRMEW